MNISANTIAPSVLIKGITLAPKTESYQRRYLRGKPVKLLPAGSLAINYERLEN